MGQSDVGDPALTAVGEPVGRREVGDSASTGVEFADTAVEANCGAPTGLGGGEAMPSPVATIPAGLNPRPNGTRSYSLLVPTTISSPESPSCPSLQATSPTVSTPPSQIQHMRGSIDDIIQERKWELRHEGNWIDVEGDDFIREYLHLPSPPSPRRLALREKAVADIPPLSRPLSPPQDTQRAQNLRGKNTRAKWSDEDLKLAIGALDSGYSMREVCEAFSIPRTSLRDHYNGRVTSRKMGPPSILTKEEENKLVSYMVDMAKLAHPLSATDLKLKVAEICHTRGTPFKDGIPGKSWFILFQKRHPHLVLRTPQPLEVCRARNLCPSMVHTFFTNLEHLYKQQNYQPSHIWNVDESGANASRNGVGRVFAPKGSRNVHTLIPNEREWISVLTAINAQGESISNFYIFKGIRPRRNYLALCEDGASFGMQKKGWIDSYLFSKWMDHFLSKLRERGLMSTSDRHLLVLDGHKAHLTLEVVSKAKKHGVDMLPLPSHTSHGLQPLDVSCFKPFKVAFRAYKNLWTMKHHGVRVTKEILANWVFLALKKALTAKNIQGGFRGAGIWPLNLEAMKLKMGHSEGFKRPTSAEVHRGHWSRCYTQSLRSGAPENVTGNCTVGTAGSH